ncbi:MAG TPA: cupredoxin domain-containing protein [Myxococcaceae bacterium]|nr:cupredoxin domain-containing protein [Myxococcaceae bacterium]
MFSPGTAIALALLLTSFPAPAADQAPSPSSNERVIKVTAKRFEYSPSVITVKLNVPVVLELTTLDRVHGFEVPDLKLQAEIKPGEVSRVRFIPDKIGTFAFHCNIFCGSGHEDMAGQIVVTN